MKHKHFIISVLSTGLLIASCSKNFQSINTDPEHPSAATMNYAYLFTGAELVTCGNSDGNAYEDERTCMSYASVMIQHLSSTSNLYAGDKYTYIASDNSAYWEQNYASTGVSSSPIQSIVEVLTHVKTDSTQTNFYNIARIFRVFMFQRMTDIYGDCPYSQAGLGYISGITQPKYDRQQDIYMNMLSELQDAAGKLDPTKANTVGAADVLYGGSVTAWQKFAYSEMLRLAMRLVKVDPTNAEKWAKIAVAGGVMTGIADNAAYTHNGYTLNTPTVNGNALVLLVLDYNATRLSQTFVNTLVNTGDPRLSYFGTVTSTNSNPDSLGNNNPAIQLGQPNGYDNNGGPTDISNAPGYPGDQSLYSIVNRNTFARFDAPTYFLTFAETALLKSEAVVRGWINGDPAALYDSGVTAAMQQMGQQSSLEGLIPAPLPGISDAAISAYLLANPFNPGDALNQINTQYWIATFMDEYEAWANWRRSGYPVLTPVNYTLNVTGGTIPRRMTYSTSEYSANAANYQAAVANLPGGDKMTSRVWWDTK
jgi:SusD/RagB-like outer membrane lipoprotein